MNRNSRPRQRSCRSNSSASADEGAQDVHACGEVAANNRHLPAPIPYRCSVGSRVRRSRVGRDAARRTPAANAVVVYGNPQPIRSLPCAGVTSASPLPASPFGYSATWLLCCHTIAMCGHFTLTADLKQIAVKSMGSTQRSGQDELKRGTGITSNYSSF